MLPKRYRLRRTKDFARTRRVGRSAATSLVALYVMRTRTPEIRIGFSVSKRVGKAVKRNRVKRLMREAVRPHVPGMRRGQDLVFIARPAAAEAELPELADATAYLLRKTGSLCLPKEARNA